MWPKMLLSTERLHVKNFTRKGSDCLWQLSTYKYLIPLQTRWKDNDAHGNVNLSVYYELSALVQRQFMSRYTIFGDSKQFSVKSSCEFRSSIRYPDVVIGGFGAARLGRSSVSMKIPIFKPNTSHDTCPLRDLGISTYGSFVQDLHMSRILDTYINEAVALVHTTLIFVNLQTERPVANLPKDVVESFKKVSLNR